MALVIHIYVYVCICRRECALACSFVVTHLSCLPLSVRNFLQEYELERAYELNMKRVVEVGDKNHVKCEEMSGLTFSVDKCGKMKRVKRGFLYVLKRKSKC